MLQYIQMAKPLIDLPEEHLSILKEIVTTTVPSSINVYIFGSRVNKTGRKYRDIDIGLNSSVKIPYQLTLKLYDKFDESSLPYIVDIVDLDSASPGFKEEALLNAVKIQ